MKNQILTLNNINYKIGKKIILDNISLSLKKGDINTIIGPNGSGKTTLLRIIIGLNRYYTGEVKKKSNITFGYMPQKLEINQNLPINASYFLALGNKSIDKKLFNHFYDRLKIKDFSNTQLVDLSGGQMQKLLLLQAIKSKPNFLVLDEPTNSLDATSQLEMYSMINDLKKQYGMTILIVSHDLFYVMSATDHVICLNKHICCQGQPAIVSKNPEYLNLFNQKQFSTYAHHHDHEHN